MKLLKDLFRIPEEKKPSQKEVDEKTIFYLFQKIIRRQYGERGEGGISFVFFREGVLGVRTKTPLWANEIWLVRGDLVRELNELLEDEVIRDIKPLH